jgi:hypothetical protein
LLKIKSKFNFINQIFPNGIMMSKVLKILELKNIDEIPLCQNLSLEFISEMKYNLHIVIINLDQSKSWAALAFPTSRKKNFSKSTQQCVCSKSRQNQFRQIFCTIKNRWKSTYNDLAFGRSPKFINAFELMLTLIDGRQICSDKLLLFHHI